MCDSQSVLLMVNVFGRSDSDSDNESGDPEKKKLQDKLSGNGS